MSTIAKGGKMPKLSSLHIKLTKSCAKSAKLCMVAQPRDCNI